MTIQELSQKKWIFPPLNINLQTEISNVLRISPLLSQLLINRGLTDVRSAKAFLQSNLSLLSDPMLLPDIEKSSERIIDALSQGEKITVYGDYDVDGISATALMVQCLEYQQSCRYLYKRQQLMTQLVAPTQPLLVEHNV